jgi:cytochrome P450
MFSSFVDHLVHFKYVLRAVSRDETVYRTADSFYPERFLNPDGALIDDEVGYVFGYGRRFCPGKFMARNVVSLHVQRCSFSDII